MQLGHPKVIFLSLCLLDFLMDKSTVAFHREIAVKDTMHLLIAMLNNKQLAKEVSLYNYLINFRIDPVKNRVPDSEVGYKV